MSTNSNLNSNSSSNSYNNSRANNNSNSVSNFDYSTKLKNKIITSVSSDSNNEDEEKTNSNMANYNYYSNIINNINSENSNNKINSSVSVSSSSTSKPLRDSNDTVFEENSTKTKTNLIETSRNEKQEEKSSFKINNDKITNTSPVVQSPVDNKNPQFKLNPVQDSTLQSARKAISNGVLNNSLSASASSLDIQPENVSNSSIATIKQESNISAKKKNKFTEWCSTQLSMEKGLLFNSNLSHF